MALPELLIERLLREERTDVARKVVRRFGHLPRTEREVVRALESMEEPASIALRRNARMKILAAMGAEPGTDGVARVAVENADSIRLELDGERVRTAEHGSRQMIQIQPTRDDFLRAGLTEDEARIYLMDVREPKRFSALSGAEVEDWSVRMMRTAGVFVLDGGPGGAEDVLDCVFEGVEANGLPPLPYSRVWIEAAGDDGPVAMADVSGYAPDGTTTPEIGQLWGVLILEIEPCVRWAVACLRSPGWLYPDPDEHPWSPLRFEGVSIEKLPRAPFDRSEIFAPAGEDPRHGPSESREAEVVCAWALMAAELITARGVTTMPAPRLQRKHLQHAGWTGPSVSVGGPQVYRVALSTSGGETLEETGRSLSCRFLVRGHWRRVRRRTPGAVWVEAKDAWCVWVCAFVKGPVGAPWKGRPVYVDTRAPRDERAAAEWVEHELAVAGLGDAQRVREEEAMFE